MNTTPAPYDAWVLGRILAHNDLTPEQLGAVSERWKPMAERLAAKPQRERVDTFRVMRDALPPEEAAALEDAIDGVDSDGPPPSPEAIPEADAPSWPAPIDEAALQGTAGDVVRTIAPTTEADSAAVLGQFLVSFGNLIGKGPFMEVDGHRHHANLNGVIVGDTSRARKGTSWRRVREVLSACDPQWASERILGGLSSGEGLIWAVRDPIYGIDKKTGADMIVDNGVADKRLLVVESEFGGALRVIGREGNTLSAVLRLAYDGDTLRFLTKNNPAVATSPHVSVCGHITREELDRHLSSVEAFNGLGNRILWFCARRSKALPFGGRADTQAMQSLADCVAAIAADAKLSGGLSWASTGASRWESVYGDLTQPKPGLLGAVTSRAEAHSLRLAMIYALLDGSREIVAEHVDAALAIWRYCADSAAFLFGRSTGDGKADAVIAALKRSPGGLTRTEIYRDVFSGHTPAKTVSQLMDTLVNAGSVRRETMTTGGRPCEQYFAA